MLDNLFDYFKLKLAVVLSLMASIFQAYYIVIILVLVAIMLDVVTGLVKSKVVGGGHSRTGAKGFWSKVMLLLGLSFGIFLDYMIPMVLMEIGVIEGIGVMLPVPIGVFFGGYILVNESISIAENLYQGGFKVPDIVLKYLKIARDELDGETSID